MQAAAPVMIAVHCLPGKSPKAMLEATESSKSIRLLMRYHNDSRQRKLAPHVAG